MSLKQNDVHIEDLREWKPVNTDIEHDLHTEPSKHCGICQSTCCLVCGKTLKEYKTLYPLTCEMCRNQARVEESKEYLINVCGWDPEDFTENPGADFLEELVDTHKTESAFDSDINNRIDMALEK